MKCPGTLFIIAAPSGGGKTSLIKALIQEVEDIQMSVSHTTRGKRPLETEGVDYFYVTKEKFLSLLKQDIFLEHAQVFGHDYGTSRAWVEDTLQKGIDVILEIDWQGAQQVRAMMKNAVSIFVLPPSKAVLRERLSLRNQDAENVIETRLCASVHEMSHYQEYDYVIINEVFERALLDVKMIVLSQRLKTANQQVVHAALIRELLQ